MHRVIPDFLLLPIKVKCAHMNHFPVEFDPQVHVYTGCCMKYTTNTRKHKHPCFMTSQPEIKMPLHLK